MHLHAHPESPLDGVQGSSGPARAGNALSLTQDGGHRTIDLRRDGDPAHGAHVTARSVTDRSFICEGRLFRACVLVHYVAAADSNDVERRKKNPISRTTTDRQHAVNKLRYQLARLHTAPQFAAVLDCLFELTPRRTTPMFEELVVVDDRLVFARAAGERTFRHFVGRRDQLIINLVGFVRHLGFGTLEHEYVVNRVDSIPRRAAR